MIPRVAGGGKRQGAVKKGGWSAGNWINFIAFLRKTAKIGDFEILFEGDPPICLIKGIFGGFLLTGAWEADIMRG